MEGQGCEDALARLEEAEAIQEELNQHRLALEWANQVFDRLLRNWMQLEAHEGLAYEDKVLSQLNILDEATTSLGHLHKSLGLVSRLLKHHRQHLNQLRDPLT